MKIMNPYRNLFAQRDMPPIYASRRNRIFDLLITSQPLYQLSYASDLIGEILKFFVIGYMKSYDLAARIRITAGDVTSTNPVSHYRAMTSCVHPFAYAVRNSEHRCNRTSPMDLAS